MSGGDHLVPHQSFSQARSRSFLIKGRGHTKFQVFKTIGGMRSSTQVQSHNMQERPNGSGRA